jgi:hypothetical protein
MLYTFGTCMVISFLLVTLSGIAFAETGRKIYKIFRLVFMFIMLISTSVFVLLVIDELGIYERLLDNAMLHYIDDSELFRRIR